MDAQKYPVQEAGGSSPPAQIDKTVKNLQEQLEAPGADGCVSFPPGWGLVLMTVFPHRPHGR